MKKTSTSVISGCLVWILAFGLISVCSVPFFMTIGSFTSASDFAINFTGKFICPDGTMPETYSYATTTRDEYGNTQPSTAYELQCVDEEGEILKTDPISYSFLWLGIITLIGLMITGGLAFLFASLSSMLISKLLNRNKHSNITKNILS